MHHNDSSPAVNTPLAEMTSFLRLGPTDRRNWLISFLAGDLRLAPEGAAFPSLYPGETRYGWLIYQFRLIQKYEGQTDAFRATVIEVLRMEGLATERVAQVIGALAEICGACAFTESGEYSSPGFAAIGTGKSPIIPTPRSGMSEQQYGKS